MPYKPLHLRDDLL